MEFFKPPDSLAGRAEMVATFNQSDVRSMIECRKCILSNIASGQKHGVCQPEVVRWGTEPAKSMVSHEIVQPCALTRRFLNIQTGCQGGSISLCDQRCEEFAAGRRDPHARGMCSRYPRRRPPPPMGRMEVLNNNFF